MQSGAIKLISVCLIAAAAAGCLTPTEYGLPRAPRSGRSDHDEANLELMRLKEQVDALARVQEKLSGRLDEVQSRAAASEARASVRLDEIERSLKALESARETDRAEIIRTLSRRIAELLRSDQLAQRSGTGPDREHIVKPGETLSAIAAAYGVKVEAIVRTNGLKDANSIRAGQRLVIPSPRE